MNWRTMTDEEFSRYFAQIMGPMVSGPMTAWGINGLPSTNKTSVCFYCRGKRTGEYKTCPNCGGDRILK